MSSIGTEFKINIHVEPIGGYHMDDYDFSCKFYIYMSRAVDIKKSDMIRLDADNYIACIDSSKIGIGAVRMRITALIPDGDFPDGLRTEVETVDTKVMICK